MASLQLRDVGFVSDEVLGGVVHGAWTVGALWGVRVEGRCVVRVA